MVTHSLMMRMRSYIFPPTTLDRSHIVNTPRGTSPVRRMCHVCIFPDLFRIQQHGAAEARRAHNPEVPGSKPGAANFLFSFLKIFKKSTHCGHCFHSIFIDVFVSTPESRFSFLRAEILPISSSLQMYVDEIIEMKFPSNFPLRHVQMHTMRSL
jgi:hypothetical protein